MTPPAAGLWLALWWAPWLAWMTMLEPPKKVVQIRPVRRGRLRVIEGGKRDPQAGG